MNAIALDSILAATDLTASSDEVVRAAERNVLVVPAAGTARAADAGGELVEAAPSRGAERSPGAGHGRHSSRG